MVAFVVIVSLVPAQDLPDTHVSDKLAHALTYGLLTLWFAGAYPARPLSLVAGAAFGLGLALEGAQALTATRAPEFGDLAANLSGIVVGAVVAALGARRWCAIVEDSLQTMLSK